MLAPFDQVLTNFNPIIQNGRVTKVIGLRIESLGPQVSVGDLCCIFPKDSQEFIRAEVVGFSDNKVLLMPLGELGGIGSGARVAATGGPLKIAVSNQLRGRILNGLGFPIDGKPPLKDAKYYEIYNQPPDPLKRTRIKDSLSVGIRAIDGLCTLGKGQRIGIFSASGVGKSTLLGMIARNTKADINVIGLIGERGREVREFIERDLGEEGLKRSVLVVATSEQPALCRIKAAFVATTLAEYFRDQGLDVMLMMDSVTRFAMSQREVGQAVGEPPATRGYTPSVFALMPRLMERAGTSEKGSITGLYTILVEGDDLDEPVADTVRGILDGHLVLSRRLASLNHYPAIDILQSLSRLMIEVVNESHLKAANRLKALLATYSEAEDLINIGEYVKGSNAEIDQAVAMKDRFNKFLIQGIFEKCDYDETLEQLVGMFD
ncbi:MAG: flagellar protein export ATPase FliI [Candidatus Wallbacteria bacterium]|nr:flagellar protein export ATPase FliI [Candidatus Wallbacteria bacterium]